MKVTSEPTMLTNTEVLKLLIKKNQEFTARTGRCTAQEIKFEARIFDYIKNSYQVAGQQIDEYEAMVDAQEGLNASQKLMIKNVQPRNECELFALIEDHSKLSQQAIDALIGQ